MKKTASLLIIILLFTSFTGCTSDFNVNEVVVKDISDKITQTVIDTIERNIKAEKLETHNLDAINCNKLTIKSQIGDINITTHDTNEVLIDINIKIKSNTEKRAEELLQNYKYIIETNKNAIDIDTTAFNGKLDSDDIIVDLNIKIPSYIDNIIISSNVGDINIDSINNKINIISNVSDLNIKNSNALYNIKTDVGNINLENSLISGESKFYLNVGDISISTSDISNAQSISAETQVGDIEMSLPKDSNYEANIHEFMKKPRIKLYGNGKTKINLIANVGSIEFE